MKRWIGNHQRHQTNWVVGLLWLSLAWTGWPPNTEAATRESERIDQTTVDRKATSEPLEQVARSGKKPKAKEPKEPMVRRRRSTGSETGFPSLSEMAAQHRLKPETIGYQVYDLDRHQVVEAWQDHAAYIPASVSKMPTAVAGLAILGENHRFETTVLGVGRRERETWQGDLYLKGGGDPGLVAEQLLGLVKQLRGSGLRKVSGNFYFDASLLIEGEQIDPQQPADVGYNPGYGALSVDFNRMEIGWTTSSRRGSATAVAPIIPLPGVRVEGEGRGGGGNRPFVYSRKDGEELWQAVWPLQGNGRVWLPVKQPGSYAARLFAWYCRTAGIALPAGQPAKVPEEATVLAVHRGATLWELTRETLKHSNNMMAEMIGLAAARQLTGQPQGLAEASASIRKWWAEQIPLGNWDAYRLVNFSGLSAASRVTPGAMVDILKFANGKENTREALLARLPMAPWRKPVVGAGGEIPEEQPKVWVKTGTMYYGRALVGVIESRAHHRLAFAVFNTDPEKRREFDNLYFGQEDEEGTASHKEEREAKGWLSRARSLEQALVSKWALLY